MNKLSWLASLCCLLTTMPAQAAFTTAQADIIKQLKQTTTPAKTPIPVTPLPGSPPVTQTEQNIATTLPIGINVGDRQVISSVLVRGQEDGEKALDFANWLVPYDTVLEALKFTATNLPDGQIELRSPGLVTRIAPSAIRTDTELGQVFSIADIEKLFNVKAEFNISEYAIVFQVPWFDLTNPTNSNQPQEPPVVLTGLPEINAPKFAINSIQQRVNLSGGETDKGIDSQGELSVVGTFFGGSTYVQLNQNDLTDRQTWTIREAQFLRQTDRADYIVGTQAPFWLNQGTGEYVGFTTIQRRGFVPPPDLYGGSSFGQRLQTNQFGRTIEGSAEPGTLVRLVQDLSDRIIAEVLVNSSGRYRFADIPTGQTFGSSYRVLLYPNGQLTSQPEIRDVSLSAIQGQLPVGASALLISGGLRREVSGGEDSNLFGNFSDFRGGIARRWGATESITLGVGAVYDKSVRGMGEIFFKPQGFPLEAAVSVLSSGGGDPWVINSDIRFTPSPSINARFNSSESSSRFDIDWEVFPGFSLLGVADSNDSPAAGLQFNFRGKNSSTSGRAMLNTEGQLRWTLGQQLGQFALRGAGSELGIRSELLYELSGRDTRKASQILALTYETRNETNDRLAVLGYSYRSRYRTFAGDSMLEAQLGYGIGSRGSGIVASVATGILPGVGLRARYQGVSITSDEASFNLELVPTLGFQRGLKTSDLRLDYLRTQGGLLVQPFFDKNNNGKPDANEEFYTEPNLLLINNKPINNLRPEVKKDRILLFLPPDTYRLDLDPAGYPIDAQPLVDAYAVQVVAGSYTPVLVPLVVSFVRSGIVTDADGKPINGAKVEAVSTSSKQKVFSITNAAGVYYLERLQVGTYKLLINGKPAQPNTLTLDPASPSTQELNLKI